MVSHFGVTVKPLPVLAGLRILAVLLGLLQGEPSQNCAVGCSHMWSVEADDVVHDGILSRWVGWGPEPP